MSLLSRSIPLLTLLVISAKTEAVQLTVNSNLDTPDSSVGDGVCNDGAGHCTLRAAIQEANAVTGPDRITFSIGKGLQTIQPTSSLPVITDSVEIDGTSQPGFDKKPLIEIDGSKTATFASGLDITGGTNTIKGLIINQFIANGILIEGNKTAGNIVQGNFLGTDPTGKEGKGNLQDGIHITDSSNNHIGGSLPEEQNLISGNSNTGITIEGKAAEVSENILEGNRIGTDIAGTKPLGNLRGIILSDTSHNRIGSVTGLPNLISANANEGIVIQGASSGNQIEGNLIGTDITGTLNLGNGRSGVAFPAGTGTNNLIGGDEIDAANIIAFNGLDGVELGITGNGTSILSNDIFSNIGLGIDLGTLASDTNQSQSAPLLTTATLDGSKTLVRGTLSGDINTPYRIDFFSNDECDPSGSGEGQRFLGATHVTTASCGTATFEASLPSAEGHVMTATTTNTKKNTSPFSTCLTATSTPASLEFRSDTFNIAEEGGSAVITIERKGSSSESVSVDFKTSDGTATDGNDYNSVNQTITFAPHETEKTISIPILDDTLVDGNLQETVLLSLSNPSSKATLGNLSSATLNIIDNEVPNPGVLQFKSGSLTINEGDGTAKVVISRMGGSTGEVSVDFHTDDGSAEAGKDYSGLIQRITFSDGDVTDKTVDVPIIDNKTNDPDKTIKLLIGCTSGGALIGLQNPAVLTIIDNDISPVRMGGGCELTLP